MDTNKIKKLEKSIVKEDSVIDLQKIDRYLKKHLTKKRYLHTYGVAYTATSLAMRYNEDIQKANLAGMLHDCAKYMDNAALLEMCNKKKLNVSKIEKENAYLLHAKVGAYKAKHKFHVMDVDILNAITYHTTGRPQMSKLEKIIYIADYIEPNRNSIPNLDEIRFLAFEDLDTALIAILKNMLQYFEETNHPVDSMTQMTYEYYKNRE